MGENGRKGNTHGFTLVETLTVVAILAILAAIAVPSVAAIQRRLRLAELDAYAQQIFLAAQNELTEMRANGALSAFADDAKRDGEPLTGRPSDYPEADGEGWKALYAVSGGSSAGARLPRAADALDATAGGGSFLLEADPAAGSVYSVFYTEAAELTYEEVKDLADRSRNTRARQEKLLGYYSGGTVRSAGTLEQLKPVVETGNGEELWVQATCALEDLSLRSGLTLEITVRGETSGRSRTWTYTAEKLVEDIVAGTVSLQEPLILDSLDAQNAFSRFRADGLLPGEDLWVTAAVTYTDDGMTVTGTGDPALVNSLFESRDRDGNLTVSCLRHLNNLRESVYSDPTLALGGVTVAQTRAVSFDWTTWTRGTDYVSDWKVHPLGGAFAPIENGALFEKSTFRGGELSGFVIQSRDNTGLFGALKHCTVKDVRLVDCQVKGGQTVGALIGSAEGVTVANCGAYLRTREQPNGGADPDLEDHTVSGGDAVGGLIGQADSASWVTDSFAALNVTGATSVGGLVGKSSGHIENCYASGDVTASRQYAGGITGDLAGGTVRGCYTTSNVTADGYTGGIAGGGSGRVADCVVYGRVAQTANANAVSGGEDVACTGCRYLSQTDYNAFPETAGQKPEKYSQLRTQGTVNGAGTSYPYAADLRGNYFPFPLLQSGGEGRWIVHYGNWPKAYELQAAALVYYEIYDDGTFGYFAPGLEGLPALNTDDTRTIRTTGYGVLRGEGQAFQMKMDWEEQFQTGANYIKSDAIRSETMGEAEYHLYPLKQERLNSLRTGSYRNGVPVAMQYQNAEGGTVVEQLYVNAMYGAAIFTQATGGDSEEHPFQIRTADQLQAVISGNSDRYFKQTHSIDAEAGTGEVGINWSSGYTTYDGGGYSIYNLRKPLFKSVNTATLRNICLKDVQIQGTEKMAPLCRSLNSSGIVQNCFAQGTVEGTSAAGLVHTNNQGIIQQSYANCTVKGGGAAGLVWNNTRGTIENCYADCTVEGNVAAGLVNTNEGTIQQSYATATVKGGSAAGLVYTNRGTVRQSYITGAVQATDIAAGLVHTNEGTIQQSYANCTVEGSSAAGFVWSISPGTIEDCYALSADGAVQASSGTAYGFIGPDSWSSAQVTNCYTAAALRGQTVIGFGPANNNVKYTHCYWAGDLNHSGTKGPSGGDGTTLAALAAMGGTFGADWEAAEAGNSHPDSQTLAGQAYPYPKLTALDHWGDWPTAAQREGTGKLGVAAYMQHYGYYAGCVVERPALSGDGQVVSITTLNNHKPYAVLLAEPLAISDWIVEYKVGNGNKEEPWPTLEDLENETPLKTDGYQVYFFDIPTGSGSLKAVRLTNRNDESESYEFEHGNDGFKYDD